MHSPKSTAVSSPTTAADILVRRRRRASKLAVASDAALVLPAPAQSVHVHRLFWIRQSRPLLDLLRPGVRCFLCQPLSVNVRVPPPNSPTSSNKRIHRLFRRRTPRQAAVRHTHWRPRDTGIGDARMRRCGLYLHGRCDSTEPVCEEQRCQPNVQCIRKRSTV